MRNIAISTIRIDGGTQPRETIDQATVDEYAEAMAALDEFPPLVVYHDGVDTWLADGFHRYHGAMKAKWQTVDVDWREGTLEMAKLYAAGANAAHGKRRTEGDRRRAIEMVWGTAEGKRWTQEQIAKHCHVDRSWVSKVLGKCDGHTSPSRDQKRAAVVSASAAHPCASDRAIAREVGVDHKTVAKVRADAASSPAARPEPATVAPEKDSGGAPHDPATQQVDVDYANRTQRDSVEGALVTIETAIKSFDEPRSDMVYGKVIAMLKRCGRA